ncbi:TPA: hypothetical protein L0V99_001173 [Escherichia coli]|nr:hypothetical protein [Escherichia coli]
MNRLLLVVLALLLAALGWQTWRLADASQTISTQANELQSKSQALAKSNSQLISLSILTETNNREQARLYAEAEQTSAQLRQRQRRIEELKRENEDLRHWADTPLPADIIRLRERPALTGGAAYRQWLSASDAVSADLMAKHLAAPDPHSQYAPKESPTFTGTPKAPTPAAGNNTTRIATTEFVQAAITALINGAPATLDTLKEIAAAINNDPKFSTTINNALALKAPLSSPALTGTPTAPTAAQSVNNTQIATTAFVKSAIAAMVGSAPAALDTLNELAAALGNDPNFSTTVLNALAGKQPLDNTLTNLSGKDVAGLLAYLGLGEAAKRNVGNEQNQIPDMAAFASSLSSTGFQKLPSGLIIQWGIVSGASNYTVTYPVTFPNRSLALLAVPHTTSVAGISAMGIANCSDISKSQFYIIVGGISQGEIVKHERSCFWVAIGV